MKLSVKNTTQTETDAEAGELSSEAHSYTVDRGEIGGREHPNANFGCPRCDHELAPGPWNSWICWRCDDVIYVDGGSR